MSERAKGSPVVSQYPRADAPSAVPEARTSTATDVVFVCCDLAGGGTQRVASTLANAWAAERAVDVITVFPGKDDYELDPRVRRTRLRSLPRLRWVWGLVQGLFARSWLSHALSYSRGLVRERITLAGTQYYPVRYEALARDPRRTTADLMSWLGLELEEGQLSWTAREHHHVAGNHMRFGRSAEIQLDEAWRQGLTPAQKAAIVAITAPARLLTPGLAQAVQPVYRALKPRG